MQQKVQINESKELIGSKKLLENRMGSNISGMKLENWSRFQDPQVSKSQGELPEPWGTGMSNIAMCSKNNQSPRKLEAELIKKNEKALKHGECRWRRVLMVPEHLQILEGF